MSDLTRVELLFLKKRIENYIRFGQVTDNRIIDRSRRVLSFHPGSIFMFVRWAANDFGTIISRADILRAVKPGGACSTIAYVQPGAEILCTATGWPRVEELLAVVDAIQALNIDPAEVAPDYWRHVHSRFAIREKPRPYSKRRHEVWLLRRRIEP